MPVRRVKGGYQWGGSGKIYSTREGAIRQGRAIEASQTKKVKKTAPKPIKIKK